VRVRRVVTGHDANGRSIIAEDIESDVPEMPGIGPIFRAWSADEPATFPGPGVDPEAAGYFPPVGGVRMLISTLNPGYGAESTGEDHDLEAAAPDVADAMEDDAPGMHTTNTTDFEVILSGTVIMELDDGAEVKLGPGDVIIQNGTRHRWRNPGPDPITMAVVMVGAHRRA
jgi:mannose-6-phosphate isomerase-like protein (cupin superfamily)